MSSSTKQTDQIEERESNLNPTEQTKTIEKMSNDKNSAGQTDNIEKKSNDVNTTEETGQTNGQTDFHNMQSKNIQNMENMKIVLDIIKQHIVENEIWPNESPQCALTIIQPERVKEIFGVTTLVHTPEQKEHDLEEHECRSVLETVKTVFKRQIVEKELRSIEPHGNKKCPAKLKEFYTPLLVWLANPQRFENSIGIEEFKEGLARAPLTEWLAQTPLLEWLTRARLLKWILKLIDDWLANQDGNGTSIITEFKGICAKLEEVDSTICLEDKAIHIVERNNVQSETQTNNVIQKVECSVDKLREVKVLDPLPSEATQRFRKAFYLELEMHGIRAIDTDVNEFNTDTTRTDVAMVICHNSYRLESKARNALSELKEEQYKKILLVILNTKRSEKLPKVSSKELLCDNPEFCSFYDIVDIACNDGEIYKCDINEKAFKVIDKSFK